MIPKQELKRLLANGRFKLNSFGIDVLRSHIELYKELETIQDELEQAKRRLGIYEDVK